MKFVGKFQQVTSPVTAKGIEDTALYLYNRLVSLNEVGGEPDKFGVAPDALHAWLADRAAKWPHGLSASSTHDTKRSEDVRARINVLSELAGEWRATAGRWARTNRKARSLIDGESYPSRNEEYLLYQTLLGTWPASAMTAEQERDYHQRIHDYMLKTMREAKVFTSWLNPSEPHEKAMARFVAMVLSPGNTAFRDDFGDLRDASHGLASTTRSHSSRSRLARPAYQTSTRAPSCGISVWSIRIIAGPLTTATSRSPRRRRRSRRRASAAGGGTASTPGRRPPETVCDDHDAARQTRRARRVPLRPIRSRLRSKDRLGSTCLASRVCLANGRSWSACRVWSPRWRLTATRRSARYGGHAYVGSGGGAALLSAGLHRRVRVRSIEQDGRKSIRAADAFAQFPIAFLEAA